jgi:hypothetical protein
LCALELSSTCLKHFLCIDKPVESNAEQSFLFSLTRNGGICQAKLANEWIRPTKDIVERVSPSQLRFGPAPK